MDSLKATDQAAENVAVAARVRLADIEAAMSEKYHVTALAALHNQPVATEHAQALGILSICIVVMRNGFSVIGKSAPASPANFDAELGKKFAYDDAVRQIWPLMGFALRDRLAQRMPVDDSHYGKGANLPAAG